MRRTLLLVATALILVSGLCFAGRGKGDKKKGEEPTLEEIRQTNRKKLYDARLKFLELYRKAKKPKEGPGRIVGFVIDRHDFSGIKGVVVGTTMRKRPKDKPTGPLPSYEATSGKDGVYEIDDMAPGSYLLEAAAEGYTSYKRRSVYVRSGTKPGLGTWLVIELDRVVVQKGRLLGVVKHIEPTFKHIKILVVETAEEWEDLVKKEIVLHSEADDAAMKSIKALKNGDTVECSFVQRSGRYVLLSVEKEEKK